MSPHSEWYGTRVERNAQGDILVNPARVDLMLMRRGMDDIDFADALGITEQEVERMAMPSGYTAFVPEERLHRMAQVLHCGPGFFVQGDEEEDFADREDIAAVIEGNIRGRKLWIAPDSGLFKDDEKKRLEAEAMAEEPGADNGFIDDFQEFDNKRKGERT